MKNFVVLFLITILNNYFSQNDSIKFIKWENIEDIANNEVYYLDCSNLKWKSIPKELSNYSNLKKLNLSKNKLKDLPTFFSDFKMLEEINLGKNEFTSFPNILFKINKLKKIIFYKNKIAEIENGLCDLKSIEFLDFWDNPLQSLPECLVELKFINEIHLEGISYGEKFQQSWIKKMPNTKFYFDKPCSCKD